MNTRLIFIFSFIVSVVLFSCSESVPGVQIFQGQAFGTTYTIQYYAEVEQPTEKGIDSVIYVINRSVSTYMPNSDISKINSGDSSVIVDQTFRDVYAISEEVHKRSFGYFDPTIGVLRNAYGFGDTSPIAEMDQTVLDSLMQYVGFDKVSLNSEGKVSKQHSEIYFDFNAVAKGYGIDRIGAYFQKKGVENYLIELGGEILSMGRNLEKDSDWIVGVEATSSELENRSIAATLKLKNRAMASSGNYRKFRIDSATGTKYVHTLNPHTGSAIQNDVTSATVIANSCAVADAYATAFMALGLEKSSEVLLSLPEVEAYLTYNDTLGNPQIFKTKGFELLLLD